MLDISIIHALRWAILVGLLLDIIGFALVFRHGHSLFLRSGPTSSDEDMRDGDYYFQYKGGTSEEDAKALRTARYRRLKARIGAYTVLVGLGFQFEGSWASLHN